VSAFKDSKFSLQKFITASHAGQVCGAAYDLCVQPPFPFQSSLLIEYGWRAWECAVIRMNSRLALGF